jgi:hypothetical protein
MMKKHNKTDTVAYATSSGFAVVYGPSSSSGEATPESSKPQSSAAKPASDRAKGNKSAKAS